MLNNTMASKRMVVMLDTSDTINFNCLDIIPLKLLRKLDQSVVNVNIERRIPTPSHPPSQSEEQSGEGNINENKNDSTIISSSLQSVQEIQETDVDEEEEAYEEPIIITKSNLTTTTTTNDPTPEWSKITISDDHHHHENDDHKKSLEDLEQFIREELLNFEGQMNGGGGSECIFNDHKNNSVNDLTPPSTSTWNISPLYEAFESTAEAATVYDSSEYLTIAEDDYDGDDYGDQVQEDDMDTLKNSQLIMMTNELVDSDCSITPVVFSLASLVDVHSGDDIVTRCSSDSTISDFEFNNKQIDWRTAIAIATEPDVAAAAEIEDSSREKEENCLENLTQMSDDKLLKILGEFNKIEEQKKRLQIVDKLMGNIAATPVPSAEILENLTSFVLPNNNNNTFSPPPPPPGSSSANDINDKNLSKNSGQNVIKCSKSKNNDHDYESKTKVTSAPSTMTVAKKRSTIITTTNTTTSALDVKKVRSKKTKDSSKKKTKKKKKRKKDESSGPDDNDNDDDDDKENGTLMKNYDDDHNKENKSKQSSSSKSKKQKAITLFSHHLKKKKDAGGGGGGGGVCPELSMQKLKNSLPRTADGRFAFSTKEAEEAIAQYVKAELAATLELGEAKLKPGKLRDVLCSVVSTEQQQQQQQKQEDIMEKCVSTSTNNNSNHNGQTTVKEKSLAITSPATNNRTIAGGDGVGTTISHPLVVKKKPSPSSAIPIMNNRSPIQQDHHNLLSMRGRPCYGIIPRQSNRMNFIKYQQQSIAAMLNISRSRMHGRTIMPPSAAGAAGYNFTTTITTPTISRTMRPPNSSVLELTRKRNAAALIGKQQLRSNRNAVTVVFGNE